MLQHRRVPAAKILPKCELSIILVNRKSIHQLNKKWRKKDKPTDVLSFPQYTPQALRLLPQQKLSHWLLGDIVICWEVAQAQAHARGHSVSHELNFLLIHGILHLLGYDHELSAREERRMQRLERLLLTQVRL